MRKSSVTPFTWCRRLKVFTVFGNYKQVSYKVYDSNRPGKVKSTTEENQYHRLADSVTPYYCRSYEKQLQIKEYLLKRALKSANNILKRNRPSPAYLPQLQLLADANDGQMCPFTGVRSAPEIFFYRNKDGWSIGKNIHGEMSLGLFVGRSRAGKTVCVSPKYLTNTKRRHTEINKVFEEYIKQSAYVKRGSDTVGYWIQAVLRSTQSGETMLTAVLRDRRMSSENLLEAQEELKDFFENGPGKNAGLTSLYFTPSEHSCWKGAKAHLVLGEPYIFEEVLNRRFRISPHSFFQTNTPAAEVLYSTVKDYVRKSSAQTVLDVCCGTGTIGVLTANLVNKVFGVESVEQAIMDAKFNAELNGVKNAEFHCEKAHRFLRYGYPYLEKSGPVIAIVNPGRMGINVRVVAALRFCQEIKHVVYISCKPQGNVLKNFVDLIVPETEKLPGEPFVPVEATGVDMFPQTDHSELVVYFSR